MRSRNIPRIIGIALVLIVVAVIIFLNVVTSKPLDYIVASRENLTAGTRLCEVSDETFVALPVRFENSTARLMLNGVAQPADLAAMRASCAVLIQDVYRYQPLDLGAVVSPDNPAADRIMRLALDDPDMIVVRIPVSNNVPESIIAGDRVDLVFAITNVTDTLNLEEGEENVQFTAYPQTSYGDLSPDAMAVLLEQMGYSISPPAGGVVTEGGEAEPTAEPEPVVEEPSLREPVVKKLVSGALVIYVQLDTTIAGLTESGEATVVRGDITAIDVVIPRDAFEFVTMAITSGNLQIGMLSPLVEGSDEAPTIGASMQDFLDLYLSDREELTSSSE